MKFIELMGIENSDEEVSKYFKHNWYQFTGE